MTLKPAFGGSKMDEFSSGKERVPEGGYSNGKRCLNVQVEHCNLQ